MTAAARGGPSGVLVVGASTAGLATAEVSIVDGSVADRRFVAHHRLGGPVTGVLGWNMPEQARQHRRHLTAAPVAHTDPMVSLGGTT